MKYHHLGISMVWIAILLEHIQSFNSVCLGPLGSILSPQTTKCNMATTLKPQTSFFSWTSSALLLATNTPSPRPKWCKSTLHLLVVKFDLVSDAVGLRQFSGAWSSWGIGWESWWLQFDHTTTNHIFGPKPNFSIKYWQNEHIWQDNITKRLVVTLAMASKLNSFGCVEDNLWLMIK